jgi:serine/threonine-protein kinase
MSPEQAMGDRELTPRSDVYALGAMTYEMLAGDPPFTGSTAQPSSPRS